MAVRNIVKIDEEKCNGCGKCVTACAEGAIKLVNGKAKLVSEIYCDGLGACIGHCPVDAITVEQRDAAEFDEHATQRHLDEMKKAVDISAFVCPGMMAKTLNPQKAKSDLPAADVPSRLAQWPVQLKLVPANAPYFAGSDLLLAADCVPFAAGDFHSRFLKDHSIAVGCPKLDDVGFYIRKLAQIIKANNLNSLTVIHMEVPCCSGLTVIAQKAIESAGVSISFEDVTISLEGRVLKTETISVLDNGVMK
jgi:NAD-dependent dihydropyrimidine dehydrogenase PreA subunit